MFGTLLWRRVTPYSATMALLCLTSACGRIGVEILPTDDDPLRGVEGGDEDGGGTSLDGGNLDASWADPDADDMDGAFSPDADLMPDTGPDPIALCMMSCLNDHGGATCASGSCVTSCANGYGDCDRNVNNGCEADIMASAVSCGMCGLSCVNPNGTTRCTEGLCAPSCASGFADCDEDTDNGCESSLNAVTSCGGCTNTCTNAHGTTLCQAGTCVPTCSTGWANCDGDPRNGCETNINSDPTHCGSCPNACGTNGQVCTNGTCQASPCAAGRAECDGNLAVTCETDTTTSLGNCGFCGNTCTTANGTPRCTSSACQVQGCNGGFGNCDSNASNGCETTLATSTNHCGACGAGCTNAHGTTRCTASACVPTCSTGWGDCDTSRPNGCEADLNTITNCGMCGRSCPAGGGTAVCNSGVCGVICNLTGTYAVKMSVASTWSDNGQYVRSGSGTFQFWMRLTGTHSGNALSGTITECGRYIPPFSDNSPFVNETWLFGYPNSLFDNNVLPASTASITLSNASPGASFSFAATAVQMGVNMALSPMNANPITAAWPNQASGIPSANRLDMDGDGRPGVTAVYSGSNPYIHPRTGGGLGDPRSDNPYVASRVSFSLSGTLNSCTGSTGSASFTHIDTRIYACSLESGECSAGQASFLDTNTLDYTLGSATYTLVKVADGASCATIRSTLP